MAIQDRFEGHEASAAVEPKHEGAQFNLQITLDRPQMNLGAPWSTSLDRAEMNLGAPWSTSLDRAEMNLGEPWQPPDLVRQTSHESASTKASMCKRLKFLKPAPG